MKHNYGKWPYDAVKIDGNLHVFSGLTFVTKASLSSLVFHITSHWTQETEKSITSHHVILVEKLHVQTGWHGLKSKHSSDTVRVWR